MTCSVIKGDTPLTVVWHKDGRTIDPSQRIQMTQVDQYINILSIENLQAEHTGNYSCIVRNSAAEAEGHQALVVNGNSHHKQSPSHSHRSDFCVLFLFVFFVGFDLFVL